MLVTSPLCMACQKDYTHICIFIKYDTSLLLPGSSHFYSKY